MQLTKIFDFLDALKNIANLYGFDFNIRNVTVDDVEQIINVRLYSDIHERYANFSNTYTSILDSRNPRELAISRFKHMMSSFQST